MGYEDAVIDGLGKVMNQANIHRVSHSERAAELIYQLGEVMSVPEADLILLRQGMLIHDIGKTKIADSIINKRGTLTEEEWSVMKSHPEIGHKLINRIPALKPVGEIVLFHHENWDGTGYPQGRKGEDIPRFARMAAIVEVWDALTNNLPYRPAWEKNEALAYMRQQSGFKFDPQILDVFLNLVVGEE